MNGTGSPTFSFARLWKEVRFPLLVTLGNRLGLFIVAYVGLVFQPQVTFPWRGFPNYLWFDGWFRWDSGWYVHVATEGYAPLPGDAQPSVFFPFYPLLVRCLNFIVHEPMVSGFIVSHAALFLASVWLYRLVSRAHGEAVAQRTLLLVLCYPFSFYFSAMYAESVFLVTTVGAFYFAQERRWLAAALCVAAASVTRLVGFVTLLPVALYYLQSCEWSWRKIRWNVLWLGFGVVGLVIWIVFLKLKLNQPFAFFTAQWAPGWGGGQTWPRFVEQLKSMVTGFSRGRYEAASAINIVCAVPALAVCLLAVRRMGWIPALWAVLTLLISFRIWRGVGRYSCPLYPAFLAGALLLEDWPILFQSVITLSTLLLAVLLFIFSHGGWVS